MSVFVLNFILRERVGVFKWFLYVVFFFIYCFLLTIVIINVILVDLLNNNNKNKFEQIFLYIHRE